MSSEEMPVQAIGSCTTIEFVDDLAIKTSQAGYSPEVAENLCGQLVAYSSQLEDEPIATTPVLAARALLQNDGLYHVQYDSPVVPGLNVSRLDAEARHGAISRMIASVCDMTLLEKDDLLVPIDAGCRNWHLDTEENPTLVDLYYPMSRNPDSSLPAFWGDPQSLTRPRSSETTQHGVINSILLTSLNLPQIGSTIERIAKLATGSRDWCYDALPTKMDPTVKRQVHNQVRSRFAPMIAEHALHKAKGMITKGQKQV